jgi:hypothetical protein
MTIRSVALGLLLGLTIAATAYFNQWVIRQNSLTASFLPVGVFGAMMLVMLLVNPLLGLISRSIVFGGREMLVIAGIALLACWSPGTNFYRQSYHIVALPGWWLQTSMSWQSAGVMSYIPGGSGELAEGHVLDWPKLAQKIQQAGAPDDASLPHRIWQLADDRQRDAIERAASADTGQRHHLRALLKVINTMLADPQLSPAGAQAPDQHQRIRVNRSLLSQALPQHILPMPRGGGVLLEGGQSDSPALRAMVLGRPGDELIGLREIPWGAWWPNIRLWGSTALVLSLGAFCLALIVHPQWSHHERLPYPIAQFAEQFTEVSPGFRLPDVVRARPFQLAFGAMIFFHGVNLLHAWFPALPQIPKQYDLTSLGYLFPDAVSVRFSEYFFNPRIYFTVIAFGMLLQTRVAGSLALSPYAYLAVSAIALGNGIDLSEGGEPNHFTRFIFGTHCGLLLMIIYGGRRYYGSIAAGIVGFGDQAKPQYRTAIWAGRAWIALVIIAVALLISSGLSIVMATGFVLMVYLLHVAISRVVMETGFFMAQGMWRPIYILVSIFGAEVIGPTPFVILCIASMMITTGYQEMLMPHALHALHLTDRATGQATRRLTPWALIIIIAAFLVAGSASALVLHNRGVDFGVEYQARSWPSGPFNRLTQLTSDLSARGSLAESTAAVQNQGAARFLSPQPQKAELLGIGLGAALVIGCAVARLRLAWWPLHPVFFIVLGSWSSCVFCASFLIGWLAKLALVRVGGARGFAMAKPLIIGLIAGEVFMAMVGIAIGAIYFLISGLSPPYYGIFIG